MANHITCPGCQTLLAIPEHLARKVLRCPRCKAALPAADTKAAANKSEAITDRPTAPLPFTEPEAAEIEARVQMKCPNCGDLLVFAAAEMGTVQECANCREYLDVPDLTTDRYERQLRETDRRLEQSGRILARWEALVDRLERALTHWEQHRS